MAAAKAKSTDLEQEGGHSMSIITRLLALIAVKGEPQAEKIRALAAAGLSNVEVAVLLGLTPNAVNVALHRSRGAKKKPASQ